MKTVRFGSVTITVRPWRHPSGRDYWRFLWRDGDKWRAVTRATQAAAIDEALRVAKRISGASARWEDLPEDVRQAAMEIALEGRSAGELRQWRSDNGNRTRKALSVASGAFMAHIRASRHEHSRHLDELAAILARLDAKLGDRPIRDISRDDLLTWLDSLGCGQARRLKIRGELVRLWEFARLEGWVDAPTAAERLPAVVLPPREGVRIFTPDEMRAAIELVRGDFLPWVVMGGFSGLRSEEIRCHYTKTKPPLDWAHVGSEYIEVPAAISKVRRRRLVPIHPTLKAWLGAIDRPKRGPILPHSPHRQTAALGAQLDARFARSEGWPSNVLRHSFGSYEAARSRNLPALAIEMGNSEAIIRRHYQEATTSEQAAEYFSIRP